MPRSTEIRRSINMGICRKPSWSLTRQRTFSQCPRMGFFEYYSEGEPEAYLAWNLRELITLPMLVGEVVDLVIAAALKRVGRGENLPTDMAKVGIKTLDRFISASPRLVQSMRQSARTAESRRSSPYKALLNDWYEIDQGAEYRNVLRGQVAVCLDTFENSEVVERIVEVETASWGPFTRSMRTRPYFDLNGLRAYTSFDFYFRSGEDLFILDWKSGIPSPVARESAEVQLDLYALYGAKVLGTQPDHIFKQAVWLRHSGAWAPIPVTAGSLEDAEKMALSQVDQERSRINVSEIDGSYLADRSLFPPVPSSSKCCFCKYREICPEGTSACKGLVTKGAIFGTSKSDCNV